MKHLITKNTYRGSNVYCDISDDCSLVSAHSYAWWRFVATDNVGNIIVNSSRYSPSTGQHQKAVAHIMSRLSIPVHLYLYKTKKSLCILSEAIEDEIHQLRSEIEDLEALIALKGSRKAKNSERQEQITNIGYRIKDLTRFLSENLNKKQAQPVRTSHDPEISERLKNSLQKFYLKNSGKLQTNELNKTVCRISENYWRYKDAPESIDNILSALGASHTDLSVLETVLCYEFSNDLNNMIPAVDTEERQLLKRFISKNVHQITTHTLDKTHTFLLNLSNRKDRSPSEPIRFPVHPKLSAISHEDFTILDAPQKLRAEGRRQNHCIGGRDYQQKCRSGYQALNFKGYTFFLSPDLRVLQTHGRFNSPTPQNIINDLNELIGA